MYYIKYALNLQCVLKNIQRKYQLLKKLVHIHKSKMLLLSMDSKLLSSMNNAHANI